MLVILPVKRRVLCLITGAGQLTEGLESLNMRFHMFYYTVDYSFAVYLMPVQKVNTTHVAAVRLTYWTKARGGNGLVWSGANSRGEEDMVVVQTGGTGGATPGELKGTKARFNAKLSSCLRRKVKIKKLNPTTGKEKS